MNHLKISLKISLFKGYFKYNAKFISIFKDTQWQKDAL